MLVCAVAVAVLACAPGAQAAKLTFSDVPARFWAAPQITWAVDHGWITPRRPTQYSPAHTVSRKTASLVLARLNFKLTGTPIATNQYDQAVDAGWISPGTGYSQPIEQWEFDRGIVRVLGLKSTASAIGHLTAADGWKPKLPQAFGAEQVVRALGVRVNAPEGSDQWEEWPTDDLTRATVAVEADAAAHLSPWAEDAARAKAAVATALPALTPLQKAVIQFALRYGGAPYVWGGEYPTANSPYGTQAAGGFDCSGFVWWVLKMQTYTAGGTTWSGNSQILARDTYSMAHDLPVGQRIKRKHLHPGDIVFWSSAPNGVNTAWQTVYHTGIYVGNGWTINSHGSGDGVTLDYMGAGAGWYHDAFAFGWRVLPRGA